MNITNASTVNELLQAYRVNPDMVSAARMISSRLAAYAPDDSFEESKQPSVNTFDFDGVCFFGPGLGGVLPGRVFDPIVTGRSIEESDETIQVLDQRGANNLVFFNPLPFDQKTRESSGRHKVAVISLLREHGIDVNIHLDDDPVQLETIRQHLGDSVRLVFVSHNLTTLENARHSGRDF